MKQYLLSVYQPAGDPPAPEILGPVMAGAAPWRRGLESAGAGVFTAGQRWPATGLPPSPAGWIITTARNRAIDRLRREASREDRHAQAELLHGSEEPAADSLAEEGAVHDDRLRLIFTCCHPALATQ